MALITPGSKQAVITPSLITPPTFPGLKEFAEISFGQYNKLPTNWHHELFYDILENNVIQNADGLLTRGDKLKIKKENKNIHIQAPRFHAKSQCFTVHYPLWELYKNPNTRIMIVSANQEIAVAFVRQIMNNLENNNDMIDAYGSLEPEDYKSKKKWGEKAFQVKRDSFDKDPSVIGLGTGGKVVSKRADIIILDDLIDMDSARTPAMRKKTLEWFENVLLPVLEDNGRLVVVGTAWYKDDLYDHLINHPSFDIRLKMKALVYHPKYLRAAKNGTTGATRHIPYKLHQFPQAMDAGKVFAPDVMYKYKLYENLKSGVLWADKWDFDKLMERKSQMSSGAFMRQYLNEPTSEEEKVFTEKLIKQATDVGNRKELFNTYDNSDETHTKKQGYNYGNLIITVGVDLAISRKTTADMSAISVWGLDDKRRRILLWLEFGRWSPSEIKYRVVDVNERFKPVKIMVENIAYQDMIRQDLEADDLPVEGFRTTAGKKFNDQTGIAQLAMLMEQNKLLLPSGQKNTDNYNKVKQLIYEMSVYSYDQHAGDLLMSSWFALHALNDFDKKMKSNRGFFSTVALMEHVKNRKAANKVLLLGANPPVYKFSYTSLVSIFREVQNQKFYPDDLFIEPDEEFMIFVTREDRSVAYIIEKHTSEIVGKIEGMNISTMMLCTLLEKASQFFNNAQIVVDKNREGGALLLELQNRVNPNLLCFQPDGEGGLDYKEGFKITKNNLPLAIDHFKSMADSVHIRVPDEALLKEMADLISVDGDELTLGFGSGQRIKTVATALWLIDYYENEAKTVYNGDRKKKRKKKELKVRYRSFH